MVKLSGDRALVKLCDLSSVIVLPQSRHYTQYVEQISGLVPQNPDMIHYPEYLLDFKELAPEFSQKISMTDGELFTQEMDLWSLGKIFCFLQSSVHLEWKNNLMAWNEGLSAALEGKPQNIQQIIRGLLEISPEERNTMAIKRVMALLQ